MSKRQAIRGRWVFPVDGPPLGGGVIEIEEGRIVAVHNRPHPGAEDLGDCAIVPGLVNVHTHLEFSDLPEPIGPAQPFTAWIRALVANRRGRDPSVDAVTLGKREAELAGTSCLGEIATSAWDPQRCAPGSARVVVFREILGLAAAQHEPQLEIARDHLAEESHDRCVFGISPHAPYSVRPPLFDALVDLAVDARAPLAMHLAETRAELQLLRDGTGEFVDMLRDFGVWDPAAIASGTRPLDYLRKLAAAERALVVHGNYLDEDEIAFVAEHPQLTVVYCPRTHAYFGHDPHPWRRLLVAGGAVAIGTDGRGSNPDLSLWRELQFLRARFPDVDPALLLELGTIRGAGSVGLADEIGSLTPGKAADLAVIDLAGAGEDLLAPRTTVRAAMCGGRWIDR